jgi:hypothetical protein
LIGDKSNAMKLNSFSYLDVYDCSIRICCPCCTRVIPGILEDPIGNNNSLLVPSKLGEAKDETHRSRKTDTKTQEKGRTIKNQTEKRGKKIR